MKTVQRDQGVTLLELAAVMAIFSVLALMGVQLLSQALSNRDGLARADARVSDLVTTIAVLRRDLEQAVPQPASGSDRPVFAITDTSLNLETAATGHSSRVTWQVDRGAAQLQREANGIVTARLVDVSNMRIDIHSDGGWTDGTAWLPDSPADLPAGLRIVLSLGDLGDIPVVVAR